MFDTDQLTGSILKTQHSLFTFHVLWQENRKHIRYFGHLTCYSIQFHLINFTSVLIINEKNPLNEYSLMPVAVNRPILSSFPPRAPPGDECLRLVHWHLLGCVDLDSGTFGLIFAA